MPSNKLCKSQTVLCDNSPAISIHSQPKHPSTIISSRSGLTVYRMSRHAPWRQRPPSLPQIKLLEKLYADHLVKDDSSQGSIEVGGGKAPIGEMTAGDVAQFM